MKSSIHKAGIIIGTIDMIGSKLLFSGYGDGRYHRPYHAGLIGQDALIVHDEAHLTPAFSGLLGSVSEYQGAAREKRPIQVMELSATRVGNSTGILTLTAEDEQDGIVQQRINAPKNLRFHEATEDELIPKMVELATKHEPEQSKVLIYIRSPESAQRILNTLLSELGSGSVSRIRLLTGTMRGQERDSLARGDPVYNTFLKHDSTVPKTVYLVSTSAGEVGNDFYADHLVGDETTLDSIIQRLGRVNRRGDNKQTAQIDIVVHKREGKEERTKMKDRPLEQAIAATFAILARLPHKEDDSYDASPRSLRELLDTLEESEKICSVCAQGPSTAPHRHQTCLHGLAL